MKSTIVIVVLLLLAAYAAVQVGSMYLAKSDLEEFVNQALDTVDDSSKDEVKGNIVAKAQKLGIAISAKNIEVVYEDADAQLVAQRLVGQRPFARIAEPRSWLRNSRSLLRRSLVVTRARCRVIPVAAPRRPAPNIVAAAPAAIDSAGMILLTRPWQGVTAGRAAWDSGCAWVSRPRTRMDRRSSDVSGSRPNGRTTRHGLETGAERRRSPSLPRI